MGRERCQEVLPLNMESSTCSFIYNEKNYFREDDSTRREVFCVNIIIQFELCPFNIDCQLLFEQTIEPDESKDHGTDQHVFVYNEEKSIYLEI